MNLNELCYFVESWLRIMGYGGEYNRLKRFILTVAAAHPNFDYSPYPIISSIVPRKGQK